MGRETEALIIGKINVGYSCLEEVKRGNIKTIENLTVGKTPGTDGTPTMLKYGVVLKWTLWIYNLAWEQAELQELSKAIVVLRHKKTE